MARKSDLQKTIAPVATASAKPIAPDCLTPNEKAVWDRIIDSLESGWITSESFDLLINYCRHVDCANEFSTLIELLRDTANQIDPVEYVKSLDRLSKMRDREVRAASSLATRLRITNQSLRSDKSAKPVATKKPWET